MTTNSDPDTALDQSGSSTFERYCYQAFVAVPFAIQCGLGSDIIAIVPEFYEDLAIERSSGWQFAQIKTRDPGLGLWKLSDLLSDSGALRSLYRTHRLLGQNSNHELIVGLEGSCKPTDPIVKLRTALERQDGDLIAKVSTRLSISVNEAGDFLARVRLLSDLPSRKLIMDRNIRALSTHGRRLTFEELEEVHEKLLALLYRGMASQLGDKWPLVVVEDQVDEIAEIMATKRITSADLAPILTTLNQAPSALLTRITNLEAHSPSLLEVKLLQGGASERLISNAKSLMFNAIDWAVKHESSSWSPAQTEDLDERLIQIADAHCEEHLDHSKPAPAIWQQMMKFLHDECSQVDRRQIFDHDPMLLLGQICVLSNSCKTDWGRADA